MDTTRLEEQYTVERTAGNESSTSVLFSKLISEIGEKKNGGGP